MATEKSTKIFLCIGVGFIVVIGVLIVVISIITEKGNMIAKKPYFLFDDETHYLQIATYTERASIYYTTDGTDPDKSSNKYLVPFEITDTMVVKAVAFRHNFDQSNIATIDIVFISPVTFSHNGEETYTEVQNLELSVLEEGADIYFTTDGSNPDKNSTLYNGSIPVSQNTLVKAVAYKVGKTRSKVSSLNMLVSVVTLTVADPFVYPGFISGEDLPPSVTLMTTTPGATIHYTIDLTPPTQSSPQYVGVPIVLDLGNDALFRMRAFKAGYNPSGITFFYIPSYNGLVGL